MDRQRLVEKYGDPVGDPGIVTNGLILEIFKDGKESGSGNVSADWIKNWANRPDVLTNSVTTKMERLNKKMLKLRREARQRFLNEKFVFPESSDIESRPIALPSPSPTTTSTRPTTTNTASSRMICTAATTSSPLKRHNFAKFKERQQGIKLLSLERKIKRAKIELSDIWKTKGHYSLKNVKRREERNASMRTVLRAKKNQYLKRFCRQEKEIQHLREEMNGMKKVINEMNVTMEILQHDLVREWDEKKEVKMKKRKAEKRASFHKGKQLGLAKRLKEMEESYQMDDEDRDTDTNTMEGGKYKDNIRMCVLELTALEVATGKMGEVINCVAENIFNTKLTYLPSRQACQNIIDEGNFIAKAAVGDHLKESKGWGLHKDGTTRKTVKILDTSVRTEDGTSFCLGFSSVVSETAEAIADEAKDKIEEVDIAVGEEGFRKDLLKKLVYFMNDRAANEKKSSRLLEEWRKEMLTELGEVHLTQVHHLFCTAHVLLGFQSYTLKALHTFNTTGQFKHPILILLRDAADLFGPVGDFRGFRNAWEGFCQEKGIKSIIKNFKDNRFNGLFEVSAQVFFHHQDFLFMLQSKTSNNAKQTRLLKALQNEDLLLVLECLGMFFFKITDPFWSLAISATISPSDLPAIVQNLEASLMKIKREPHFFFDVSCFTFLEPFQTSSSIEAKSKLGNRIRSPLMENIIENVSSAFLDTINAQMADFLSSGKYGSREELEATAFAPANNLLCERNFGALDASQRRRPSASLHHHSSVLLLKQNRGLIKKYCSSLSASKRKVMWAKATVMGKALRMKHRAHDKDVSLGSLKTKLNAGKPAARRGKKRIPPSASSPVEVLKVEVGEMVAVACEDCWYPGIALEVSRSEIKVDFAELGKGLGYFKWPNGRDVHTIDRGSVLATGLEIEARAGGRSWLVINAKNIQKKFEK